MAYGETLTRTRIKISVRIKLSMAQVNALLSCLRKELYILGLELETHMASTAQLGPMVSLKASKSAKARPLYMPLLSASLSLVL